MHELSLAMEICRIAGEQLPAPRLARVVEVGVDVGDRSGVEPDNLEFCLEALLSEPPFGRASPALRRLEGDVLRVTYVEAEDDDDG